MKLSERTISVLAKIITGDEDISPYRSGPKLVNFFNTLGSNDVYGQGFPSRWKYVEDKIREFNDTENIQNILCQALDPRDFMGTEFDEQKACEYLNSWLKYDGYEMIFHQGLAKVRDLQGRNVRCGNPFQSSEEEAHIFIDEQIQKSEKKIQEGDYDGAITNARSLLESVLIELEKQLDENPPKFDGDLLKLYKRVQKGLRLEPGRSDIERPLKQVLSGLTSIVGGISSLSNRMGDRHVRSYKPAKHHAELVVNAGKTMANFLFQTHSYQKELRDLQD